MTDGGGKSLKDYFYEWADHYNGLTAEIVVKELTPPEHPYHNRLEWDDSVAGEKYRLVQAAQLIRSIKITYKNGNREHKLRGLISVTAAPSPSGGDATDAAAKMVYVKTTDLINNKPMLFSEIEKMKAQWRAFKKRWEHLAEFADLFGAVDIEDDGQG